MTRFVDEELRLRNAYLVTENRILRQQMAGRVPLGVWHKPGLAQRLGVLTAGDYASGGVPNVEIYHSLKPTNIYFNGSKSSELRRHLHF
jgi:hypothetical protein